MIDFFENCNVDWGSIAFYGSSGKGILNDDSILQKFGLPSNFFNDLRDKYQEAVEKVFGRKVRPNTSHAQKWDVGGFAAPHSDNSDHEGTPNAFEINKYVGVLYLNDDYRGGELYFCDKDDDLKPYLSFKPNAYSYYGLYAYKESKVSIRYNSNSKTPYCYLAVGRHLSKTVAIYLSYYNGRTFCGRLEASTYKLYLGRQRNNIRGRTRTVDSR
jgi:hypothetical protein